MEGVGPRQAVLVTCKHKGKDNIVTLAWHSPLSFSPPMYAIVLSPERFSHKLIEESKEFVVNFISKEWEKDLLYCGRHSGREVDKFENTSFQREDSQSVGPPRLKQCLAFLECKVVKELTTGDHTVFVGKVVNSDTKEQGKRLFHLSGDRFATTSKPL